MKDPLDYLNDANIDLEEYEEYYLDDIEKERIKDKLQKSLLLRKNKRSSLNIFKIASGFVATIIVTLLILGTFFPTYASNIPGVKNVISFLNRNKEIEGYEEVVTPIMKTIKVEGYDINIESAYYNGQELTLFYNIVGQEKLDTSDPYWFNLKVDYGSPAAYEYNLEYGEFLDENTFAGMILVYINPHDGSNPPKIFNGTLDITNLCVGYGNDNMEIESETIQLSLDSTNLNIKEFPINKEISYNENSQEIVSAKEYPTGIVIEGKNNYINREMHLGYILWDSNKGELKGIGGFNTNSDLQGFQYRLPGESSDVYIVPYVNIENNADYTENHINKDLIKLEKSKYDLGSYGTFEILDIYDEDDKTIMKVRATGEQTRVYFYLRGDGDDEYYSPIYSKEKKVLGILDMEVTYVFNKFDKNCNYYLETSTSDFKILEDQIIKIER